METKVLSTRIPSDVFKQIERQCKKEGINRSQYLIQMLAKAESNTIKMSNGGQIQQRMIPADLHNLLAASGAAVTGIAAFNLIGNLLDNAMNEKGEKRFTETEVEIGALLSAVSIGILASGLIRKLVDE